MANTEDEHSVFNEPHLRPDARQGDASEQRAWRALEAEKGRRSERDYQDGESVYDEPDVFPGRAPELIEQDWSCDNCGYNLRGLETGRPCPECGARSLYRPAKADAASYQSWLRARIVETSARKAWTITILLALCGGPWAIAAALLHTEPGALGGRSLVLLAVVFGPVIEEVMKIGAAACVVETRPHLFKRVEQLQIATVGAALLFAAIENVIYLYVYMPSYTLEYALWRWTVCVALHVGCTLVATRGLVQCWRQAVTELRPPKTINGYKALVTAILIHSTYNAAAILYATMF